MKFKEYCDKLNSILKDNPEMGEYNVVYACDDEGNDYRELYHEPSIGVLEEDGFIPEECFEEYYADEYLDSWEMPQSNTICIN